MKKKKTKWLAHITISEIQTNAIVEKKKRRIVYAELITKIRYFDRDLEGKLSKHTYRAPLFDIEAP